MKDFDFEKSLKELEDTVSLLEKGDMSLDESIKTYKKGIELSKECSKYLEDAKQKIISLSEAESVENND
ncbi:MAG: exodeoxyribonuclease VII small subunit [Clostridia bacterium]|nr:exodeoxyribonuclease VII small subunit [Clostridia bacterium]